MKVYSVLYSFKSDEEETKFILGSMEGMEKMKNIVEIALVDGDYGAAEIYFKFKKDADKFAKQFNIPCSEILKHNNYTYENPWLPLGCNSFEDCYEIYGDIPGDRGW